MSGRAAQARRRQARRDERDELRRLPPHENHTLGEWVALAPNRQVSRHELLEVVGMLAHAGLLTLRCALCRQSGELRTYPNGESAVLCDRCKADVDTEVEGLFEAPPEEPVL